MTLLYRCGDEVLLHAPREVLVHAVEGIRQYCEGLDTSDPMQGHLLQLADALRAEAQHEPVTQTEEWLDT